MDFLTVTASNLLALSFLIPIHCSDFNLIPGSRIWGVHDLPSGHAVFFHNPDGSGGVCSRDGVRFGHWRDSGFLSLSDHSRLSVFGLSSPGSSHDDMLRLVTL